MPKLPLEPGPNTVPLTLRGAWWCKWTVRCDEHNWQSQPFWLASTVIEIGRMHVHLRHVPRGGSNG